MNAANLHLLINHFPIVLAVVGALAAMVSLVTKHRSTWTFALGALALAGLTVYPAFFTGEGAEDVMRNAWYISRDAVEAHEAAAKYALWTTLATGLVAIGAMWRERTAYTGGRTILASPGWLRGLVALLGVLSAVVLFRTAWTAGYVVHKAQAIQQPPAAAAPDITPAPITAPSIPLPSVGTTTGVTDTSRVIQPPR